MSFAQVGFGESKNGLLLANEASSLALSLLGKNPPAVAAAEAAELIERSPLTAAGAGSPRRGEHSPQLDAVVQDSLAGFGSVTLFDAEHSPSFAALQLVKNPGLSVSGFAAFEQLQLQARRFSLKPSGDAGAAPAATPPLSGAVSVLVRSGDGRFAAALSYGGREDSLAGQVSSVTVPGVSIYCGPEAAISVTWAEIDPPGPVARMAYKRLAVAKTAAGLSSWVLEHFGESGKLGVVVITENGLSAQTNAPWVHAHAESGEQDE